ncbi:MAG: JAB domain-containing protein [Cellvibrionaceae bacterium]
MNLLNKFKSDEIDSNRVLIERAKGVLLKEMRDKEINSFDNPKVIREYLPLHFSDMDRETFVCLYLDQQHRLIECRNIFYGTINCCAVYPREVARSSLLLNASAVVFAHNHPSGSSKPSDHDIKLTVDLTKALELLSVRVLDHFIVTDSDSLSFREQGYL